MLSSLTMSLMLVAGQPALTDASFHTLRDQIIPAQEQLRWKQIPWRPTLWEGVQDAHRMEKPVLLFVMNGHPLGCT